MSSPSIGTGIASGFEMVDEDIGILGINIQFTELHQLL
jgi:hypothetical protein